MNQQVQIGDMVHLNSGSPDLKVVGKHANQLEVEWLGDSGSLERMSLPAVCFKRVA